MRYREEVWVGGTGLVNFYLTEAFTAEPIPESLTRIRAAQEKMRELKPYVDRAFGEWLVGFSVLACYGEARWAGSKSDAPVVRGLPSGDSRSSAWKQVLEGNRELYLKAFPDLEILFREYSWSSAYGGYAWADIVEATVDLMIALKKRPYEISWRIDHLVDLAHNNSIWLDKILEWAPTFCDIKSRHAGSFWSLQRKLKVKIIRCYPDQASVFAEYDDGAHDHGIQVIGAVDYVMHMSEIRRLGREAIQLMGMRYRWGDVSKEVSRYDDYEEKEEVDDDQEENLDWAEELEKAVEYDRAA